MNQRLDLRTAALLTLPPLLWAGNAVVGRVLAGRVPPITLNLLRWALAFLILLPIAGWVVRPGSPLWKHWKRFAILGLLGVGCYNALQYLALKTSTPLNVTLVAGSVPIWMLLVGALFFGQRITPRQIAGAVLSIAGVLVVLSRGEWDELAQVRLVPGDFYVLLATLAWAFYSWLLSRPGDPPEIRKDWAAFLMAQMALGVCCRRSSRRANGPRAIRTSNGAGPWPRRSRTSRSFRRSWRIAAGASACSAWARPSRASSRTSRRCSRRCCPRPSSANRRACITRSRSC